MITGPEAAGEKLRYSFVPCLDRVPLEYHFHAGERAAIRLAQALLELDTADPSDRKQVRRDPTDYVQAILNRWIDLHGGKAIRRRFCLRLMLITHGTTRHVCATRDCEESSVTGHWQFPN